MKNLHIKLTFTEEILGTASNDAEIHERFIASKSDDTKKTAEEIAAIPAEEKIELAKTIFPKNENGEPFIWDYQIKGFLKDATGVLRTVKGTESSKVKAYKKYIDGRVFVSPRKISLDLMPYPNGDLIGSCQRPLRGQTAQGERIALANSETINAGTTAEFDITLLADEDEKWIRELLEYGQLRGLGQWRNSGKGTFVCEVTAE